MSSSLTFYPWMTLKKKSFHRRYYYNPITIFFFFFFTFEWKTLLKKSLLNLALPSTFKASLICRKRIARFRSRRLSSSMEVEDDASAGRVAILNKTGCRRTNSHCNHHPLTHWLGNWHRHTRLCTHPIRKRHWRSARALLMPVAVAVGEAGFE